MWVGMSASQAALLGIYTQQSYEAVSQSSSHTPNTIWIYLHIAIGCKVHLWYINKDVHKKQTLYAGIKTA
jgi:hypothetical protein